VRQAHADAQTGSESLFVAARLKKPKKPPVRALIVHKRVLELQR
jgi:hypothetical protein